MSNDEKIPMAKSKRPGDLTTPSRFGFFSSLVTGHFYGLCAFGLTALGLLLPRAEARTEDFSRLTARLDELQDLGANILWLMPIYPIGEKQRKGTLGSPYAIRDFSAVNPDY